MHCGTNFSNKLSQHIQSFQAERQPYICSPCKNVQACIRIMDSRWAVISRSYLLIVVCLDLRCIRRVLSSCMLAPLYAPARYSVMACRITQCPIISSLSACLKIAVRSLSGLPCTSLSRRDLCMQIGIMTLPSLNLYLQQAHILRYKLRFSHSWTWLIS